MKITIDTKEDSSEDIRKVIALLSKMVEGDSGEHSNIFGESSSESSETSSSESSGANAFANMFGNNNSMDDGTPVLEPTSSGAKEEAEEPDLDEESAEIIEY